MIPYETGNLIRCDCGHAASQHGETGCTGDGCSCTKTSATIVMDEIAALRPEWLAGGKSPGGPA